MASSSFGPVIGTSASPLVQHETCQLPTVADIPGLPSGFPATLNTEMAWIGPQFPKESQYIYCLNQVELDELNSALQLFKALGLDGDLVSRENFPLPTLGEKISLISQDIHHGKGFAVIRGLDPLRYAVEDLTILYLGIQGYVANRFGRQDKKGNMLVHIVADSTTGGKAEHHRHSTSSISFHTEESGDIVSWLTRSTAAAGGKCIIASTHAVYNVLASSRPDILRTLARSDWPFALPRFQCRPILFHHDSKILMNFGRTPLMGSSAYPRPAHLPTLTPRQVEALDAIEAVAQATQLEIQTRAGDIHFINNLAVLHRREAFVNGSAPLEKRHLVRMRLRNDDLGWSIPEALTREWFDAFGKAADRVWHLEPMPDAFFPLRKYPN